MIFAGSRWNLMRHGRSPCAAVALDVLPGGFVDGVEEGAGIDELIIAGGCTTSELVVVHRCGARRNEQICDGDPERVGDALNDIDPDVSGAALDARDGRARNSGSRGELILRKTGPGASGDEINTKRRQRWRAGAIDSGIHRVRHQAGSRV
jgi:hypothetical protein